MMRLIDADLIPYELWTTEVEVDKTRNNGTYHYFQNRYMVDRRAIEAMPTVNQWIPCSERLPEANGRYLVTRGINACGSLCNRTYIANYSDLMGLKSERDCWSGNVGKLGFEKYDDVTAWMPLPEPYGGDGK